MYECDCPHCVGAEHLPPLSDAEAGFSFSDDVIARALENIYRKEFNPKTEIEPGLFRETWRAFNQAADKGFQQAHYNPTGAFANEIRHNNAVFSAFRVHRQQNDMASRLLDENGNLKSFGKWKKEVEPIADHYNKKWLKTEYDTAVIRAHRAAEWKQFEAEADVLPNLEWMPSTSKVPGEDHRIFWGTIRPVNDVFWTQHKPGDRWNCKCGLQQTDKPATGVPTAPSKKDMPAPGLENNPAGDGKLFSDKHPYKTNAYRGAERAVRNFIEEESIGRGATANAKILRDWSRENIQGQSITHAELSTSIQITGRGIKEFLNQPHSQFFAKNELIMDLPDKLKNSIYRGVTSHKGRTSHIFEIEILGEKSWLIANENITGDIQFYSITDSNAVLEGIKK